MIAQLEDVKHTMEKLMSMPEEREGGQGAGRHTEEGRGIARRRGTSGREMVEAKRQRDREVSKEEGERPETRRGKAAAWPREARGTKTKADGRLERSVSHNEN